MPRENAIIEQCYISQVLVNIQSHWQEKRRFKNEEEEIETHRMRREKKIKSLRHTKTE